MRFGAGRGHHGVVLVVTLGTGIGSALFSGGVLVPNTELGHLQMNGQDAEHLAQCLRVFDRYIRFKCVRHGLKTDFPGGAFLVYQFTARARDFMAKHFRKIDSGFELLNILPCFLFWGWKDED